MAKSKIYAYGGSDDGHLISAGVMTGTNVLGPVVVPISMVDSILFLAKWTGTPTGTFKIELSIDYVPNRRDMSGGGLNPAVRAGNWIDVTSRTTPAVVNPAGSASTAFFGFPIGDVVMAGEWLRVSYTNASGVGVLDLWAYGKAIGG